MKFNLSVRKMVKNVLFLAILSFAALFNLNGQIQKKTLMLGGNIDLYLETASPTGFGFTIHPTFGYFPIDNLVIGLQLDSDFHIRNGDYYTTLGLGPMVRYYLGNESLSAFGHLNYLASVGFNNVNSETSVSHIVFPGIGLNYMLFPTVGLEGLLGIYLGNADPTISISLGFQFFIPPNL